MKKIYLTEQQLNYILEREMINEGVMRNLYNKLFGNCTSREELLHRVINLVSAGIVSFALAVSLITSYYGKQYSEIVAEIAAQAPAEEWREICNDAVITVYNAKASQCNNDYKHTASMFSLNLNDVASHRIVALERTFMKEYGLKFGDVIKIEGTYRGLQDGVYQIQDVMNKRFAGQHKVDVLVPNEITHGGTLPDQKAKIYILNDKDTTQKYLALMAPQDKK